MSALLSSSAAFPPRKEFLKNQATPHVFALLVFNGTDILRLSNFPPNVIATLKALFESQRLYRAFREDAEMGVSEFVLADKIWAGKNIRTERLITLMFSAILSHNFRYVTSVAYGRIAQDTKSLVFSKSAQPPYKSRSNSPSMIPPPLPSASLNGPEGSRSERACFALSLTSKSLRVMCAPKSCTPAILASVRSAWPRGVVSEGRPEDDVYEFHLKGYSMFSSSTFDRDALVHMFALLRSLDAHAFQLVTNINLTQGIAKSRSKDLWIFESSADPPSPPSSGDNSRHNSLMGHSTGKAKELERVTSVATATTAGMAGLGAGYNAYLAPAEALLGVQHVRAATAPSPLGKGRQDSSDTAELAAAAAHARNTTSPTPEKSDTFGRSHSVLRKAPPPTFAQFPGEKPKRRNSKSSDKQRQSESPVLVPVMLEEYPPQPPPFHTQQSYQSQTTHAGTVGPLSESEYAYGYGTPGAGTTHPNSEYLYRQYVPPPNPGPAVIYRTTPPDATRPGTVSPGSSREDEGLLSADAFRGTAYSGTSEASRDVPVTWTGDHGSGPSSPAGMFGAMEDGERTPLAEKGASRSTPRTGNAPLPHQPEMVGNGQSVYSDGPGRPKSEKAFMGVMPTPLPSYPLPSAVPVPIPSGKNDQGYFGLDMRPGAQGRMQSTASTILPPGGFPKTPMPMLSTAPTPPVALDAARQRMGSGGSMGSTKAAFGSGVHTRSGSKSSAQRRSNSPPGKGWVLVNVERGRKTSMDAAVAAMESRDRERARAGSQPTVTNVRVNDSEAEAYARVLPPGVFTESPVEDRKRRQGSGDDEGDFSDQQQSPTTPGATDTTRKRKGSLKKIRRSDSGDENAPRKKFLGLFSVRSKGKKPTGANATTAPTRPSEEQDDGQTDIEPPISPVSTEKKEKERR